MISELEEILKRFSTTLDSDNEIKVIKKGKEVLIKGFFVIIVIFNVIFFNPLLLTKTTIKAFLLSTLISIILFFIFSTILVNKFIIERLFLTEIYDAIERRPAVRNQPTLTKEEFIDFFKLIDKYEDGLLKNKISTKGLKESILNYVERHLGLSEEEFFNSYKSKKEIIEETTTSEYKPSIKDFDKEFLYKYLLEERIKEKDEKVEKYLKKFLIQNLNKNMFSMEEIINIYISNSKENDFVIKYIKKSNIYEIIKPDLQFIKMDTGGGNNASL